MPTSICAWVIALLEALPISHHWWLKAFSLKLFFYIFNIKVTTARITYNITYELLYNTTKTVPGEAISHDNLLAININLNRNTIYLTIKKY